VQSSDAELLKAFREAVVKKIRRDLADDDRRAESLRAAVLPKLRRVLAGARARAECRRAWLFGSYAWGKPNERSDVDVMVEGCAEPFRLAAEVAKACNVEVDIVELERAAESLRDRALREGMPL
jgi:predicted nucleotidyltransferase